MKRTHVQILAAIAVLAMFCGGCYRPDALPQSDVHTLQEKPAQPLTLVELRAMAQEVSDRIALELKPKVKTPSRVLLRSFTNEAYGRHLSQLRLASVIIESGLRANGFTIVTDEGMKAIAERIEENANGVLEQPTLVDLLQTYDPPKLLLFGTLSEYLQRDDQRRIVARTYVLTVKLYDVTTGELAWTTQVFRDK